MDKVVLVDVKNVYGNEVVYPANNTAELLAAIAGTKTLTARTLRYAEEMGFEIKMVERDIEDFVLISRRYKVLESNL
jgi:excinuclease UvrABC helicase subunit UvrB